ncbi:MAG: LysR family transcriptional regulator [Alphaproteobacteria bacterium HGW-Alphaproteobacteria-11]|nr:MAG: LysR family transcriptional regulator [Alphaproteobacteria bacterium HGW-Alphaproteobacteria-11]
MPERNADHSRFPRHVDWNLFRIFHEIVRAGGIGAAARKLNRQQPTLSAALKRLEDDLGTPLLRRTAQGVELLPAGRALFELCETMIGAVRAAPHEVAKAAGRVEGVINIRMISSVVSAEFDAALVALHRHHPGVGIHIDVCPWREVIGALKSGEAEIGIACDSAPDPALRYQPLMKEVQQLYCDRNHALYGQTVPRPADLADRAFVATGADEPEELASFRRRYGLGRKVGGIAENLHEAKRLIELGVGIGFLPTCVAETLDSRGALWPLLPETALPTYQVYLVTRDEPARNTPTELFLAEILGRLGSGQSGT